jgi:hypothetical protein
MASAHIYPLSRLVHAGPGTWQRAMKEIEEGARFASQYYTPMRDAVVRASRSRHPDAVGIVADIKATVREAGGRLSVSRMRDNVSAFEQFLAAFHPRISKFRHSFLHERNTPCNFGGLDLYGAPHFEVVDADGRLRHVFLHAAKWSKKELAAYLELLAVIVEEGYGGDASSLWGMDLRSGEDINWRTSSTVRKRCKDAAALYARFVDAMGKP